MFEFLDLVLGEAYLEEDAEQDYSDDGDGIR
jgi:hypothetical protein